MQWPHSSTCCRVRQSPCLAGAGRRGNIRIAAKTVTKAPQAGIVAINFALQYRLTPDTRRACNRCRDCQQRRIEWGSAMLVRMRLRQLTVFVALGCAILCAPVPVSANPDAIQALYKKALRDSTVRLKLITAGVLNASSDIVPSRPLKDAATLFVETYARDATGDDAVMERLDEHRQPVQYLHQSPRQQLQEQRRHQNPRPPPGQARRSHAGRRNAASQRRRQLGTQIRHISLSAEGADAAKPVARDLLPQRKSRCRIDAERRKRF